MSSLVGCVFAGFENEDRIQRRALRLWIALVGCFGSAALVGSYCFDSSSLVATRVVT